MDKIIVKGGKPLLGEVKISGAKNATLPIIAATLLSSSPMTLRNIPQLQDVANLLALLSRMGVEVCVESDKITIDNSTIKSLSIPYDLVKVMRASILVLGPMLAKYKQADIALPGGCAIGARPIDLHIEGMRALGAEIETGDGFIHAQSPNGLIANNFHFSVVSVTGTENVLMAAVLAKGITTLTNAAQEPEVTDLANMLVAMGAKIDGIGTSTLTIEGVEKLNGCDWTVMPDRIEAGTYAVAAVITKGKVKLTNVKPNTLTIVLDKLREVGADITTDLDNDTIEIDMQNKQSKAVDIITLPYPEFPTDMQAQFCALNAIANGKSVIEERIYENRFMHCLEMNKMNAKMVIEGNKVYIEGVEKLKGAQVKATDLRASAALVLAALSTDDTTEMTHIYHMDRGYDNLEEKLTKLGANIVRVSANASL